MIFSIVPGAWDISMNKSKRENGVREGKKEEGGRKYRRKEGRREKKGGKKEGREYSAIVKFMI